MLLFYLAIRTVLRTEDELLSLICRKPYTSLYIVTAYYGMPNCHIADVTQRVVSHCNSEGTETYCTFVPGNNLLGGDPCAGPKKMFIITYYCI